MKSAPAALDEHRGPRHLVRLVAGELHAEARFVRRASNQGKLAAPPLLEAPRHHHFADQYSRAELDTQASKRKVRPFRHGGQDDRAGKRR